MHPYLDSLRAAAEQRRRTPAPPVFKMAAILFAAVGVVLVLSIFLHREGRSRLYNFASQRGVVTVVSALCLSMAAAFAFAAASLSRGRDRSHVEAWLLFAAGLAFLAADELLQFNLWLGLHLEDWIDIGGVPGDDLVLVGYGLVAGMVGLLALPALISQPRVGRFLLLGFGFFIVHTLFDVLGHGWRPAVVFEESAKVFSDVCLLLAAYVGLMSIGGAAASRAAPDS